jgi:polysaccharide biosynthesis/export protein
MVTMRSSFLSADLRGRLFQQVFLLTALFLAACAQMPVSGPSTEAVRKASTADVAAVQVIDVDDRVVRQIQATRKTKLFSEVLTGASPGGMLIGAGDALEMHIWEAPPATLFSPGGIDPRATSAARSVALPEQTVDHEGMLTVPFAGRIKAAGLTPHELELEVQRRLQGKANRPEVVVRLTRNTSASVTVVGEVSSSIRMPLTAGRERLLDALAAAGGVRQPVSKMTLQVTRGSQFHSLPLDLVIRDPRQNVSLMPGDVVTALFQPLSFTALGATGRNEEINFEAQGISLAQALARAGGLIDNRSDAQGLFLFRLEPPDTLSWPRQPVATTPDGLVPVVYRIDLRNPASFFVMQGFQMSNRDVLYVSNAPLAEVQKFLNLVFSVAFPVLNAVQAVEN